MPDSPLSVYCDKHVGRCDRCKKWQGKSGGHTDDSNLGTEFDDGSGRSLCPKCWKEVYDAADDATKARMKTVSAQESKLPEDTPQKAVSDYLEANAAKLINGFDYKPMPAACKIAAAEIVALLRSAEQPKDALEELSRAVDRAAEYCADQRERKLLREAASKLHDLKQANSRITINAERYLAAYDVLHRETRDDGDNAEPWTPSVCHATLTELLEAAGIDVDRA